MPFGVSVLIGAMKNVLPTNIVLLSPEILFVAISICAVSLKDCLQLKGRFAPPWAEGLLGGMLVLLMLLAACIYGFVAFNLIDHSREVISRFFKAAIWIAGPSVAISFVTQCFVGNFE